MNKLLAIIKREYLQRVRSRMFLVVTILGPLIVIGFGVVPRLIFNLKSGGPFRIAVVDETGRMYERVRDAIERAPDDEKDEEQPSATQTAQTAERDPAKQMRAAQALEQPDYVVEQVATGGRTTADVQRELNERVKRNELDAILVLPRDLLTTGEAEYFTRNTGDEDTKSYLRDRLSEAVAAQRMADEQIDPAHVRELSRRVKLNAQKAGGGSAGSSFALAFGVGFFIYLTILMYGQAVLGAVVEEKTTRITEMLFSSVDTFKLMIGKLLGVSLVALTQFTIWALAFTLLALRSADAFASGGMHLPYIAPSLIIYAALFFLLGYFLYATIYLLIGAMVTTAQEGGQLSMPIVFLIVIGFWLCVPVIRNPNSPLAVWASLVPFFAPITMLVRIVAGPPPFTQVVLSLALGFGTVLLLIWLAARVYRVGMLMYGKRASLPEVLRWVRQQ